MSRPSRFWFGTAAMTCDAFAESQVWWSRKPSSVQHNSVSDGHLSRMAVARHLKRPTRDSSSSGRASPPIWPCSSWGLPCHGLLPAVRWALTPPFHPYPRKRAVCFLWPFPSPFDAQVLPGSSPYGARTFLDTTRSHRDRHAPPSLCLHRKIRCRPPSVEGGGHPVEPGLSTRR